MAVDIKEIGVSIRRYLRCLLKSFYKCSCDHSVFVGILIFAYMLYWFFPSLFAFFISYWPIIMCTAILLGTLLSFGQPNIPEVEKEEKKTHNISSLKTSSVSDHCIIEKEAEFHVETKTEFENIKDEEIIKNDPGLIDFNGLEDHSFVDNREIELEVHEQIKGIEVVSSGENLDGNLETQNRLKSSDRRDRSSDSDSDSDCAESDSPDASLADIIPILDELHPLLESENAQTTLPSPDESDRISEDSEEITNGQGEEDDDDEGNNEPDEEAKVVVSWTEDDQKNVMDLGTSDIERNRRLEKLIAKRFARKQQRLMAEKNLIDLDNNDLDFTRFQSQIPPISMPRRNPFDFPFDSDQSDGLPPIPGSAPSVLVPRTNPFDLPNDFVFERSNLMGEGFDHQNYISLPTREMQFRRHESFSVGTSFLGETKQERQCVRMKPFFLTEEQQAAEASTFAELQRQLSETSEYKVNSVHETESTISLMDREGFEQEIPEIILGINANDSDTLAEVNLIDFEQEQSNEHEISSNESNEVYDTPHITDTLCMMENVSIHSDNSLAEDSLKSDLIEENHSESSSSASKEYQNETERQIDIDKEQSELKQMDAEVIEPVYDRSPSNIDKSPSDSVTDDPMYNTNIDLFHSISMELFNQMSQEPRLPPEMPEKSSIFPRSQEPVLDSSEETMWVAPLSLSFVEENELRSSEVNEIRETDVIQVGLSGVQQRLDHPITPVILEKVSEHQSSSSSSSSSSGESEEDDKDLNSDEENELVTDKGKDSLELDCEASLNHQFDSEENVKESFSDRDLPTSSRMESPQLAEKVVHTSVDVNVVSQIAEVSNSLKADRGFDKGSESIKEIDEELLSELNVVGDFSIQNLSTANFNTHLQSSSDALLELKSNENMTESLENISGFDELIEKEVSEPLLLNEMHVVEAKSNGDTRESLENISGFDELQGKEALKPLIVKETQVVEAKSIEGIDQILKAPFQFDMEQTVAQRYVSGFNEASNSPDLSVSSELLVIGASSAEDMNITLKQFSGFDSKVSGQLHPADDVSESDKSKDVVERDFHISSLEIETKPEDSGENLVLKYENPTTLISEPTISASAASLDAKEDDSNLHFLEVTSLKDLTEVMNQFGREHHHASLLTESFAEVPKEVTTKVEPTELNPDEGFTDPEEIKADIEVHETKSGNDVKFCINQSETKDEEIENVSVQSKMTDGNVEAYDPKVEPCISVQSEINH